MILLDVAVWVTVILYLLKLVFMSSVESPKIKFSLSSDSEGTLKNTAKKNTKGKAVKDNGDGGDDSGDSDKEEESAMETVHKQLHARVQSDCVLNRTQKEREEGAGRAGDGEEEEDEEEESKLMYNTADILTLSEYGLNYMFVE